MVSKVAPKLVTDQVYASIRAAILRGELPAGHRLRIRDLAAQVGTSVMPVREAIGRLEEAGLAVREPNKGAVVRGLSVDELDQVYDARRVLEAAAARAGARACKPEHVVKMQWHYNRIRAAVENGDLGRALDADEALLATLYRAGGNPVVVELINGLWHRCRAYKLAGANADDDTVWSHHQLQLIQAAKHNDGRAAARVTEQSLRDASRRIRARLD